MSSIRVGILTVSDRSYRGEREDLSGKELVRVAHEQGWSIAGTHVLPDEETLITDQLISWADSGKIDVILTTGGTGFAPRDVTPEATRRVIDRPTPGISESIRAASLLITPHAMLSRAESGIRGKTLIINLPGSPKGAVESLGVVIPVLGHAVDLIRANPAAETGHSVKPSDNQPT